MTDGTRDGLTLNAPFSLPVELRQFRKRLVDPARRIRFDRLERVRDRKGGWNRQEHVDVIVDATGSQRFRADVSRGTTKKIVDARAKGFREKRETFLRAEDDVRVQ